MKLKVHDIVSFVLYGCLGLVLAENGIYFHSWSFWIIMIIVMILNIISFASKSTD